MHVICHMRRRIHPCHMSYEEEDKRMAYEEEDTCMSYKEEDTYLPPGMHCSTIESACHMRSRHVISGGGYMYVI